MSSPARIFNAKAEQNDLFSKTARLFKPNPAHVPLIREAGTAAVACTAKRGVYDRRAMALNLLKGPVVPPHSANALAGWLAFMDAYGDLRAEYGFMEGIRANAIAARIEIIERNLTLGGYDGAASVIAWDFFRKTVPDFDIRLPEIAARLTPEMIEQCRTRSAFHIVMADRLDKDEDFFPFVMDDPDAFAHRAATLMQRELTDDEFCLIGTITLVIPEFLQNNGFISPQSLFEKEAELESADQNITDLKRNIGKHKAEIVAESIKEHSNRKERRKTNRDALKIVKKRIKDAYARKNDLKENIDAFKKLVEARDKKNQGLRKSFENVPNNQEELKTLDIAEIDQFRKNIFGKAVISPAERLIEKTMAREILNGLFTTYATDLKKANAVGRRLRSHLMSPREMHIERDLEEGRIDPSRLTAIALDPFYGAPFMERHEKYGQDLDTAVEILIDNSGSMKGDKIALAFIAADRLSFWLNNAGIPTEILGFTTVNGSKEERPHHIIYKKYGQIHRQETTEALAAMLERDLMKNNIDSEAVRWAHGRALNLPARRKMLLVISDGKPHATYAGEVLSDDLKLTINDIEMNSHVEIVGIGIQTDVDEFYASSIRLDSPYQLIETMANRIRKIIDTPQEYDRRLRRNGRMARSGATTSYASATATRQRQGQPAGTRPSTLAEPR